MNKEKFYITTAIIYTNGAPHIGFAFELILADVLARYHRLNKEETYFLTGTDEHGSSVAKAAEKAGLEPQVFVDRIAKQVYELTRVLNISNDDFIRTSDKQRHWPAAEKIWKIMAAKGDIYKKKYKGLYCVGHEAFIKKSDLVDGLCPLHQTAPEEIEEENYFFKLNSYKKEIKKKIETDELKILPLSRKNEILNLIDVAEDVSFSRPRSTLNWGIPVPDDPEHTQYVWTDALTNYISALGYGNNEVLRQAQDQNSLFERFWPADIHLIGKDILRFHALYWPAMLMSAGLPIPKALNVHGFINVDGQKMSKTIGNVIDPFALVEKYGSEVVRYFLMREIPSGEDGDFSYKKLEERYNGDLANGLGNLIQRVATLINNNLGGELILDESRIKNKELWVNFSQYQKALDEFRLHDALGGVWKLIGDANRYIDDQKPWAQVKDSPEDFLNTITTLVVMIHHIAWYLQPFMPDTAKKIFEIFGDNGEKELLDKYHFRINLGKPLFPRLK